MKKQVRFLGILWAFVICDFVLFQNFTQNVSPTTLHNDQCKQILDLNESRILHVNSVQADVVAAWPAGATSDPRDVLRSMTSFLLESNRQIYNSCIAQNDVLDSHTRALDELSKLADPSQNTAWKKYVAVLDKAVKALKGSAQ